MSRYDNFSKEELIQRIEELESKPTAASTPTGVKNIGWFREKYSDKILDSIPDMLTIFDQNGMVVDLVSSVQTNHAGVPTEKLPGQTIESLLTGESARNLKTNLNNAFSLGHWSMSFHDITLNGHTHNYENRVFPLDSNYALCMCRDITTENAAQQELKMLKYAMNNVDEEIYACDVDGTMIYANERFRSHHKIVSELSQSKVYDYWLPTGNHRQWLEYVEHTRSQSGIYKHTVRVKDEQGHIVAWDIVSHILYDKARNKEIVWFFGHDVTQRIAHENKLNEMNSVMNSILNNIPVYLFVKDPGNEFRYLYWNRAFETYSGIPASKALGHTDFEIFPNVCDAEKFRKDDLELLHKSERVDMEEKYIAETGDSRYVNTSKALVSMENRLPLIIGVSWDITDRKNTEAEIIEARNKALESDRLKSAFLANMSHEIRTPLNAIVGFSKLVVEADTQEEKQQYAEIIDTNAELLLQLINDILDISKIEAGTLEFKYKPMELNELCRSEYEVLKMRLNNGVTLIFDEKYDQANIVCDQNRLAQVITNLLTNACKFTKQGEIRFGFDMNGDRVDFYVKDTGIGIAEAKLNHIFDRFVKLNNFAVGTGLGLSITKMIVEKVGGHIWVESEEGKGSCFRFSIPINQEGKEPLT